MPYLVQGGAKAFKEATKKEVASKGPIKIRVSGKNLAPIVAALEHYEGVMNGALLERQCALCTVISKCRKWLDLKRAKIQAAQDMNATVKMRETCVTSLMNEAWTALDATDGGDTSDAFRAYDARRQAGSRQTRTMAPGYTQERDAYVRSGKTRSLSASLVDDLLDKGRTRNTTLPQGANNPARQQALAQGQALKARLNKAVKNRPLSALTPSDWQKIDRIASATGEGLETRYVRRGERLQYLLDSDGAGGLWYAAGQRSAATVGTAQWPYAMDEWGNIYTAHDQLPQNRAGKAMFNHSSFTAGDEVVCAGMLEIDAVGRLGLIDNNSGHYKPTVEQLRAVVTILMDDYGVDMSGAEIHVVGADGQRTIWGAGEAPNFRQGLAPLPPHHNVPLPQPPI